MAIQAQYPAWVSRGWMSFTVANGNVLYLGSGTNQTAPTAWISNNITDATSFLATGIPQDGNKTRFADIAKDDTNGHAIKHAIITICSGGATSPAARTTQDGVSVATTSLGAQRLIGDVILLRNQRASIYAFTLFNRSSSNLVVEVEVFE